MARRPASPGRTLTIFFISVAVLYGLVALGGSWKPALGLDLEGRLHLAQLTLATLGRPDHERPEQDGDAQQGQEGGKLRHDNRPLHQGNMGCQSCDRSRRTGSTNGEV